jgi:hypothetical protein
MNVPGHAWVCMCLCLGHAWVCLGLPGSACACAWVCAWACLGVPGLLGRVHGRAWANAWVACKMSPGGPCIAPRSTSVHRWRRSCAAVGAHGACASTSVRGVRADSRCLRIDSGRVCCCHCTIAAGTSAARAHADGGAVAQLRAPMVRVHAWRAAAVAR